jgi:hypothetical protein
MIFQMPGGSHIDFPELSDIFKIIAIPEVHVTNELSLIGRICIYITATSHESTEPWSKLILDHGIPNYPVTVHRVEVFI